MNLSEEESRLYTLIWERFIASQLPDAEYLSTSAKVNMLVKKYLLQEVESLFLMDLQRYFNFLQSEEDILPLLQEGPD